MYRIGILEYRYHSIFLYTLARICKTKQTHVTLFTTKAIFSLVEPHLTNKKDYRVILKEDKESINHFLKQVQTICNEDIDLLFVNTIQETLKDLPHYFNFKTKCPMILTIHDANTWLKPKLVINLRKPMRTLDTLLSNFFIQKIVLPKYAAINVVYPPIKEYIQENTTYKKPVFTIPFNFYDGSQQPLPSKNISDKIMFVAPGEIIKTRRDHVLLLDVFEQLFEKYPTKISLTILGRPIGSYGKNIIRRCERLNQQNYDITWFEAFVPEETYIATYQKADIIIAPIKLETTSLGTIQETFGKTKASGAPYEAIQYVKPIILPQAFNLIKELKDSTITYVNADDLIQKITHLILNPKTLISLQSNAVKNTQPFSLPVLQDYFKNNLLNNKDL